MPYLLVEIYWASFNLIHQESTSWEGQAIIDFEINWCDGMDYRTWLPNEDELNSSCLGKLGVNDFCNQWQNVTRKIKSHENILFYISSFHGIFVHFAWVYENLSYPVPHSKHQFFFYIRYRDPRRDLSILNAVCAWKSVSFGPDINFLSCFPPPNFLTSGLNEDEEWWGWWPIIAFFPFFIGRFFPFLALAEVLSRFSTLEPGRRARPEIRKTDRRWIRPKGRKKKKKLFSDFFSLSRPRRSSSRSTIYILDSTSFHFHTVVKIDRKSRQRSVSRFGFLEIVREKKIQCFFVPCLWPEVFI